MSQAWANGSTRAWRRIRATVILRDLERCRAHADGWCAPKPGEHTCLGSAPLSGPNAGHAHHTLGRAITGDDLDYIVAACPPCNTHIGNPADHADPPVEAVTQW